VAWYTIELCCCWAGSTSEAERADLKRPRDGGYLRWSALKTRMAVGQLGAAWLCRVDRDKPKAEKRKKKASWDGGHTEEREREWELVF